MEPPDLSEFYAAQRGPGVAFGRKLDRFLEMLPDDRAAKAQAALADMTLSTMAIERVFRAWAEELGIELSAVPMQNTIRKMRPSNG